jgi:hypothetical protein
MPSRIASLTVLAALLAGAPAAARAADLPVAGSADAALGVNAGDLSVVQRDAVRSAASLYFGALASGDYDQLNAIVTPGFRQIEPDGSVRGVGDVIGAASRVALDGSKPQGRVTFGAAVFDGGRVRQPVDDQTYTYSFVGGRQRVVRSYSSHTLTLVQAADGSWRVAADRLRSENTYY